MSALPGGMIPVGPRRHDCYFPQVIRYRTIWLLMPLLLVAAFARTGMAEPMLLEGEIQRGETMIHRFEYSGNQFEFRLVPMAQGWAVWIDSPGNRQRNYVVVVTPPFRGINPAVIQGWQFRNAANTGPNKPGEGGVNAPGKVRNFGFVLDGSGYQAAHEALDVLMWPDRHSEQDLKAAIARLDDVPKAMAKMEIEALELGNLVEGDKAWIERMAFRLQINLP
jgi:hypothetical protein